MATGSVSRILSASRSLQDGHSSRPHITMRLQRPTRNFHPITGSLAVDAPSRRVRTLLPARSLFGLAPCGVCHAPTITGRAVRSYRTFSPLPRPKPRRYVLCGTGRRLAFTPASRTLSGTLLCGVRTFLPHRRTGAGDRPIRLPTTALYRDPIAIVRKELWRRPTRISDRAEYCIRSRRQTSLN